LAGGSAKWPVSISIFSGSGRDEKHPLAESAKSEASGGQQSAILEAESRTCSRKNALDGCGQRMVQGVISKCNHSNCARPSRQGCGDEFHSKRCSRHKVQSGHQSPLEGGELSQVREFLNEQFDACSSKHCGQILVRKHMFAPYGLARGSDAQAAASIIPWFCGYCVYAACFSLGGNQPTAGCARLRGRVSSIVPRIDRRPITFIAAARNSQRGFLAELDLHFAPAGRPLRLQRGLGRSSGGGRPTACWKCAPGLRFGE
jgi:hypothetical protein